MTNHDVLSLVLGPLILFGLLRRVRIPAWANLFIALVALLLVVGLWGVFLNLWAFAAAAVWAASKGSTGLRVLRVLSMAVAVLLILAAVGFYIFVLVTNPGGFFRQLGHPLSLLYLMPGIAMFTISQHLAGKIADAETAASVGDPPA